MFSAFRWDDRDTNYWPSFNLFGDSRQSGNVERPTVAWNLRRKSAGGKSRNGSKADTDRKNGRASTTDHSRNQKRKSQSRQPIVNRQGHQPAGLLWIDAVGGFLVFMGDQITIGQAVPETNVELPILGDLSRRHAIISRTGDDYIVHPIGVTRLDDQLLGGPARLDDHAIIGLGHSVRLRFRQPNPLSNTARLDLISPHRTQPSSDGIIMMSETCILGPAEDCHVVCKAWEDQLALMPTDDDRIRFKASGSVTVDDVATCDVGVLDWGSRLAGEDFALMFERL